MEEEEEEEEKEEESESEVLNQRSIIMINHRQIVPVVTIIHSQS